MNHQFDILDKSIGYTGFFRMEKYRLRHELFRGGWSAPMIRECFERGHAVAVLLYDPEQDQVVLVEQFRIGAIEFPGGPWLLEIVAGIIDQPDESAEQVAQHRKTRGHPHFGQRAVDQVGQAHEGAIQHAAGGATEADIAQLDDR